MSLTYSQRHVNYEGDLRVWYGTVTGDASYPTGGESLDIGALGFANEVVDVDLRPAGGYVAEWDLDQLDPTIVVYYGNYDSSDGPLIEAANATDLHLIVFNARIAGT